MALYDKEGGLLGVAGVEMTRCHLKRNLLSLPGLHGVQTIYLLHDAARIVTRSTGIEQEFDIGTSIDELHDLDSHPNATIVDEIRNARSGHLSLVRKMRRSLTALTA